MNSQKLIQKSTISEIQAAIQTYKQNRSEMLTPLTVDFLRQPSLDLFGEISQKKFIKKFFCKHDSQLVATYIFLVLYRCSFLGKQVPQNSEIDYFLKKLLPIQKKLTALRQDPKIKDIWIHASDANSRARENLGLSSLKVDERPQAKAMHLIDDLMLIIEVLNFDLFKIILPSKNSARIAYASKLKNLHVNFFNSPNYKLICFILNSKKIKTWMGLKVVSKERGVEKEISRYEKSILKYPSKNLI